MESKAERQQRNLFDAVAALRERTVRRTLGVVKSIGPLVVTIDGQDHSAVSRDESYVPAVDDVVWVSRSGRDVAVHGCVSNRSDLTALPLAAGWANLGGANRAATYYRAGGRVYLQGGIGYSSGGNATIATLPVGFRPSGTAAFTAEIFTSRGGLTITSAGVITDGTFSALSKAALFLDAVSFRVPG